MVLPTDVRGVQVAPSNRVANRALVVPRAAHITLPAPSLAQLGLEVITPVPDVTFQPPHVVPFKTLATNVC